MRPVDPGSALPRRFGGVSAPQSRPPTPVRAIGRTRGRATCPTRGRATCPSPDRQRTNSSHPRAAPQSTPDQPFLAVLEGFGRQSGDGPPETGPPASQPRPPAHELLTSAGLLPQSTADQPLLAVSESFGSPSRPSAASPGHRPHPETGPPASQPPPARARTPHIRGAAAPRRPRTSPSSPFRRSFDSQSRPPVRAAWPLPPQSGPPGRRTRAAGPGPQDPGRGTRPPGRGLRAAGPRPPSRGTRAAGPGRRASAGRTCAGPRCRTPPNGGLMSGVRACGRRRARI